MAQVKVVEAAALPPLEAWQTMSVRVTGFPADPITREVSWWADLVGYPPEAAASRPKVGQYGTEGEFEGRQLSLQVQPDRFDWSLAPVIKLSEEEPSTLPLAGPFSEVLGSLMKIVERWLPVAPTITRLAFGAALAQPCEDRRSGYIQIAKYLPNVALDPDSSDFLYQINRPRASKAGIENLRINRLMKWSVMQFHRFSMAFEKLGIRTVGLAPGDSACRLELDINTVPDFKGNLLPEKLPAVLRELVDLAFEIAAKGDIP